jgi:hypothetical protein
MRLHYAYKDRLLNVEEEKVQVRHSFHEPHETHEAHEKHEAHEAHTHTHWAKGQSFMLNLVVHGAILLPFDLYGYGTWSLTFR